MQLGNLSKKKKKCGKFHVGSFKAIFDQVFFDYLIFHILWPNTDRSVIWNLFFAFIWPQVNTRRLCIGPRMGFRAKISHFRQFWQFLAKICCFWSIGLGCLVKVHSVVKVIPWSLVFPWFFHMKPLKNMNILSHLC